MSQFNRLNVPTLSTDQLLVNGFYFNTQYAGNIIANGAPVPTTPLTTEVIINDQTKNQALFANIIALEGEIGGNVNANLVVVDARLSALEGNVAILQGNVNTINSEITNINSNISILQGNVNTINNEIANINSNVSGINANTQYLRAPYNGAGGSTSYFVNGLQVWNGANENGTGIFSYVNGAAPASQISLRAENGKNILLSGGSTNIVPQSGGNVNINGNSNSFNLNVGAGLLNNTVRVSSGDLEIKGNGLSVISMYTEPATLIPPSPAIDRLDLRSNQEMRVFGDTIILQENDGAEIFMDGGSMDIKGKQGGTIDLNCISGSNNNTINIGTDQGLTDTGFTEIKIGNSTPSLRSSSTSIGGDFYLPIPNPVTNPNSGLWDAMMYVGLPTIYAPLGTGPVKSTFTPYFKSISTFFSGLTVNSFVQGAGTFTVAVGVGAINLAAGAGGLTATVGGGLLQLTALTGGISCLTAGGAISMVSGAGAISSTTGAGPIQMETNTGDILIQSGGAPGGVSGSTYITPKDYLILNPEKQVIIGENGNLPIFTPLINTWDTYTLTGNVFSTDGIGNVVISNVFTTTTQTTYLRPKAFANIYIPLNANIANPNLLYANAFMNIVNADTGNVIYTSGTTIIPQGFGNGNGFNFGNDDLILPSSANLVCKVYPDNTLPLSNLVYSTWNPNISVASNIGVEVNVKITPNEIDTVHYVNVFGNVYLENEVDSLSYIRCYSNVNTNQSIISNNYISTTGNVYADKFLGNAAVLANGAPSDTTNALYNVNGDLYFNGNIVNNNANIIGNVVNQIIAGNSISISPISGIGTVTINSTYTAPVTSIIAGNGIQISPLSGLGNVTVELAGSVIPPGGYLPINGGTMLGSIYQFPGGNVQNTTKKYRPVSSYQPPFPAIGPPTFTGEQLTFFNGDNSPEQTGFTGWFPQYMVPAQPNVMTEEVELNTVAKFYENTGGSLATFTSIGALVNNFQIGDHIKGGSFVYTAWDSGAVGDPRLNIINVGPTGKTIVLFSCGISDLTPGGGTSTFPELDYTYTGGQQENSYNQITIQASIDLGQGDPSITAYINNSNWVGSINLATNQKSQFIAVNVDSSQAVIYEFFPNSKLANKLITVGLTNGTYATNEDAVSGIFLNPQRLSTTRLIYIYGRFDRASVGGGSPTVVNNIFAFNIDTNTIVPLVTNTTDPVYSATPPVGTNGRVNGVYVSQIIVDTFIRYSVYFWGLFTGPNQMGNPSPPTGINWTNNGFAITDNDTWSSSQNFRTVSQQYTNCETGICIADDASLTPDDTQFFIYVGSFNGNVKNTVMGLTFQAASLNKFSTGFCFLNGDVGTSTNKKVRNIQTLGVDGIFFLGDFQGNALNANLNNVAISSIAATSSMNGNFYANGNYNNPFLEICGSANAGFWIQNGDVIGTTCIQTSNVNINPVNYLIGTTGYYDGNNGGGVLLFDANLINNPAALPTKEPILGQTAYTVNQIPSSTNDPNAVQMVCSLNQDNYWFSQTFDTTNPLIPPEAPIVRAINGAIFAVANHEMDKIVFSGTDTDYNSVSFIAGDVEAGDKYWYWSAQVGSVDYYAGNVFFPNVTAIGNVNSYVSTPTLNGVLLAGNSAGNQSMTDLNDIGCVSIETGKVYQGNNLNLQIGESGDTLLIKGATTKGSLLVGNGVSTEELVVGPNTYVLRANALASLGVEWSAESVFTPNLAQVLAVGNSSGSFNIDLNNNQLQNCSQITATGDLILNPVGSVDLNGKTLNMTNGEIHNVPLIHSQNNNNLTIEAKGTGDLILKTNNIDRITVNDTGVINFQGGASYNNSTNTFTANNFTGLASQASTVNTSTDATNTDRFLSFKSGTGFVQDLIDNDLTYNPSTNLLVAPNISSTSITATTITATTITSAGNLSISPGTNINFSGGAVYNPTTNRFSNVADPSDAQDLATKNYVDSLPPSGLPAGSFTGDYIYWNGNVSPPAYVVGNTQIRLGSNAGNTNMGVNSIAIGQNAGTLNQSNNSIIINAQGTPLNTSANANVCYIAPIRNANVSYDNFLNYDPSTKEVVYNYFMLPVGNTNQRPSNPLIGMMRYNTTSNTAELYNGSMWKTFSLGGEAILSVSGGLVGYFTIIYVNSSNTVIGSPVEGGFTIYHFKDTSGTAPGTTRTGTVTPNFNGAVEYLVLAGGGGGGQVRGGGGGAGGLRTNYGGTGFAVINTGYTVTVGNGGNGAPGGVSGSPTKGADSVFSSITASAGGCADNVNVNGGCGAGGGGFNGAAAGLGNTPSTTPSQGKNGGSGINFGAGGGGGTSLDGANGTANAAGNGGNGTTSLITGTSLTFGGGGGGGHQANLGGSRGLGGTGGGGNGGLDGTTVATSGTNGLGGGGGGSGGDGVNYFAGGAGGSGCVIIRFPSFF